MISSLTVPAWSEKRSCCSRRASKRCRKYVKTVATQSRQLRRYVRWLIVLTRPLMCRCRRHWLRCSLVSLKRWDSSALMRRPCLRRLVRRSPSSSCWARLIARNPCKLELVSICTWAIRRVLVTTTMCTSMRHLTTCHRPRSSLKRIDLEQLRTMAPRPAFTSSRKAQPSY